MSSLKKKRKRNFFLSKTLIKDENAFSHQKRKRMDRKNQKEDNEKNGESVKLENDSSTFGKKKVNKKKKLRYRKKKVSSTQPDQPSSLIEEKIKITPFPTSEIKTKLIPPPTTAKCAVCLQDGLPWRRGVVCEHSYQAYKEHWVCDVCFLRVCKDQPLFPFKYIYPNCNLQYTDSEILHLMVPPALSMIPPEISTKWVKNSLKEMKLEENKNSDGTWRCPSCYLLFWLEKDFKGTVIRCGQGASSKMGCNKLFCRLCGEPAHWQSTCEEVKARKENMMKDEVVLEQVKKQVKTIKCPQPSCVDQPILFRSSLCNKLTCPKCKTIICGNCSELVKMGHFCDHPDTCTQVGCNHCPQFPGTKQDLEYLECGGSRPNTQSCGNSPPTKASRRTPILPRSTFSEFVSMFEADQKVNLNDRDVPKHVSDEDYAAMLEILTPWEIRRLTSNV